METDGRRDAEMEMVAVELKETAREKHGETKTWGWSKGARENLRRGEGSEKWEKIKRMRLRWGSKRQMPLD